MKFLIGIFLIPTMTALASGNFKRAIPGEYIVKGNNILSGKVIRSLGKGINLVKTNLKIIPDNILTFQNYEYVGNFLEGKVSNTFNDEQLKDQFHHRLINSKKAWNITLGSEKIVVAVTDNEFELDHDDLKKAWWKNTSEIPKNGIDDDNNGYIDDVIGWDFLAQDNNVDVIESPTHGTHVSGIIAAAINNKIGGAGIAPNVKVMPLRWYGDEGQWTTAVVVETYRYAVDNGANIITTSYNIDELSTDPAYLDVVKYIKDNGILLFNSAGNDRKKNPPRQSVEDIILVCSVKSKSARKADKKSAFSNYGTGIDICAPGDPILSSVQGRYEGKSRYGELEGTSMASPAAAAVAALIWSRNPNFTADEVRNKLYDSADNIDSKNKKYKGLLGAGRINSFNAVK
jgi:subtilisin family serine protease